MPGFVLASPNTEDIQMFMKILDILGTRKGSIIKYEFNETSIGTEFEESNPINIYSPNFEDTKELDRLVNLAQKMLIIFKRQT